MAKEGDYTISNIYQGGYSSFNQYPSLSPEDTVQAKDLGLTTDLRSANILQEINSKLSTGVKHIEISPVPLNVFESIPKQHFKEARREAELVGAELTIHGSPNLEASGLTQQGFSESNRESTERQMDNIMNQAHELNPNKSAPVTFHSSAMLPGEIIPKGQKEVEDILIINKETKEIGKIPLKEREFPGEEEISREEEIKRTNERSWTGQLNSLEYTQRYGNRFIEESGFLKAGKEAEEKAGKEISPKEEEAVGLFNSGQTYLKDSYTKLKDLYDTAAIYSKEDDKKMLNELKNRIENKAVKIKKINGNGEKIALMQEILQDGLKTLNKIAPPEIHRPLNEFAKDKTTTTFANVAFGSYNKFKDNAPILSIENPPAGGAFSTGKELKDIIIKSRKKFVDIAEDQGISRSEAKKQAEKLIGVTWDVGHINMMRKHGWESKDLIKETEAVAPLVKHVHLSDNFGFEHTELPMGMGNVPTKEIIEKLGKEGYKGKKVIEAGNWYEHFFEQGGLPFKPTLEGMGSPIYKDGPSWNQTLGFQQDYFGGYGLMLPQQHLQMYGSGFSQLPAELGGQIQGAQGSRMSGKPME